ncbi:SagB/ThcOx family dehydrogenase [Herminiimonas sp.]|uniref:SagB/ThcOx family dehydrogenase n=1 Tax=Herminiimonas sp. TaxID=1926289 RepID=UPI00271BC769|nr:SagB/ThcOx family dehydrogenase [Herminiimonas sp.]MDO8306052.1 SagB/ThcOx family dehydrogenase [Herminiimonas sp.]
MTTPIANTPVSTLPLVAPPTMSAQVASSDLEALLLQTLYRRKTSRDFSDRAVSLETLSRLLWAACGCNRLDDGHRTNPSAMNWQEIDIYVALAQGLYLFDPHAFVLRLVQEHDIRAATGWQDFVPKVPINLIYVANLAKIDEAPIKDQKFYAALDTGFISQNVYLFCAAAGLATVARGWVDRPALAKVMNLGQEQRVILAQSVGYPMA